jgi:hypothetical protein
MLTFNTETQIAEDYVLRLIKHVTRRAFMDNSRASLEKMSGQAVEDVETDGDDLSRLAAWINVQRLAAWQKVFDAFAKHDEEEDLDRRLMLVLQSLTQRN